MKYKVIRCRNAEISDYVKNFNKRLEKFLNNGWSLHGELQVVVTHNEFIHYHQAIIKDDVEETKLPVLKIADLNMKCGDDLITNVEYIKEQTIESC